MEEVTLIQDLKEESWPAGWKHGPKFLPPPPPPPLAEGAACAKA